MLCSKTSTSSFKSLGGVWRLVGAVKLSRRFVWLGLAAAVAALAVLVLLAAAAPPAASAPGGSDTLPRDGDFAPAPADNPGSYLLNIAQAGCCIGENGVTTNAPETWAKLYYDPSNGTTVRARIFDAPFSKCSFPLDFAVEEEGFSGSCPGGVPSNDPKNRVWYDFYSTKVDPTRAFLTEEPSDLLFSLNSQTGGVLCALACPGAVTVRPKDWSDPIAITLNPIASPASSITGQYVLVMRARWQLPRDDSGYRHGRLNSFKLQVLSGTAGYWAKAEPSPVSPPLPPADGQYAILSTDFDDTRRDTPYWRFDFAPPCLQYDDRQVALRWSDADHYLRSDYPPDGGEGDRPPDFTLFEINPAGTQTAILNVSDANAIGGQDEYREAVFTAKARHKYRWEWHNIKSGNDVVLWVPYDSFYFNLNCGEVTLSKAVDTAVVSPGQPFRFALTVQKSGSVELASMTIGDNIAAQPIGFSGSSPNSPASGPPGLSWTLTPAQLSQLNSGGTVQIAVDVVANAGASPGTYTNTATATATDTFGGSIAINPSSVNYQVTNPRYPYLTSTKGNVHAGGGIGFGVNCAGSGRITGYRSTAPAAGSQADYVISAGNTVTQFGSAGGGGDGLTFGNSPSSGGYHPLCRPDLPVMAEAYIIKYPGRVKTFFPLADPNFFTLRTTGPICGSPLLSDLTDPLRYCIHNGDMVVANGNVSLPGFPGLLPLTVQRRFTLYVRGDVTVTRNIVYAGGAYSRERLPSFGLIANNLYVTPGVDKLDGFYFAKGEFNSCQNPAAPIDIATNASACAPPLTLNGLAMANRFRFKRTGPVGTDGPFASETANFTGLLYVATPPAFSDAITPLGGYPRHQREKPPVY
ncbi:hypothetical protein KY386_01805 [Candidatus Parcubacteria bacterium]|nr:hypothetical protein [Candidatus Parcubacteria bacterium]